MEKSTWSWCFLLLLQNSFINLSNGALNLHVKRLEPCDLNYDYPMKMYATFRSVDNKQYCDGNATFKISLDDNLKSYFTAELLVGKNYVQMFKLEEKHSCSSLHRYIGEFAYGLERAAQLVPGLCPIPPGRYHVHNYPLNFNMITFQSLPFGHMRLTEIVTDGNNQQAGCIVAEIENRS